LGALKIKKLIHPNLSIAINKLTAFNCLLHTPSRQSVMSSNASKMIYAEANAAHQGDKAALLAAINEAASNLGGRSGVSGGFARR